MRSHFILLGLYDDVFYASKRVVRRCFAAMNPTYRLCASHLSRGHGNITRTLWSRRWDDWLPVGYRVNHAPHPASQYTLLYLFCLLPVSCRISPARYRSPGMTIITYSLHGHTPQLITSGTMDAIKSLVHGQVTIIFVVSVSLSVCLCRVFLSRLRSDFDETWTYVTCLGL